MNYEQALEYIHARRPHQDRARGLERFSALLEKLGNPHKKLRFIHIAGSSGKGSTAAMCESVLRHAGYKTGLYISPFVIDFRERIQINGELAKKRDICRELARLMPALEQMKEQGMECTEFDIVTALAFMIFAEHQCQIVALEVGIGGKGDRTNVIDPPEVAVICSISLEHTEILGHTIPEIAEQKCGIIKPGCRVAAYPALCAEAERVLNDTCQRLGIAPRTASLDALNVLRMGKDGSLFEYKGERYSLRLAGMHQIMNALTARAAIEELRLAGWDVPDSALKSGLAAARFAGRLQIVRKEPVCVIDGAHNPEKIDSLCKAIDSLYPDRRIITVMGMKADKDFEACIPPIARRSAVFIAVTPGGMGARALPAARAAEVARADCADVRVCEDPFEAGRLAVSLAENNDMALACGSIYIIGDVKRGFLSGGKAHTK